MSDIKVIIYPVKDFAAAKKLYSTFLGAEPYADSPYYVGYKVGDLEVGLAHEPTTGPITYCDVDDIQTSLQALMGAGAKTVQAPTDVGGGLLIAKVKDADGNVIGLRQQP